MEKYTLEQLYSLANSTVSILKFNENESFDGTIETLIQSQEGDYLTLYQHEDERFYISDIEEIYLHIDGHLPVYYSSLDNYEEETYSYSPEFIEGFYDYIGQQLKVFGKFEGFYELTGTLSEIRIEELQLVIDGQPADLWRINMMFQIDENYQRHYIAPADLSASFDEPLDNLYSMEDFDMLIGRKIRIKTMDPDITDEMVTVSGYALAEGYSGDEVYHLELEEFPDHLLEPSEIQFIYLIGEDGSETLVEPSGGSLYHQQEQGEEEDGEAPEVRRDLEARFYREFVNNILPELRPYREKDTYHLLWLKFGEETFGAISEAIREWYETGTPASFSKTVSNTVRVFDSRTLKEWYLEKAPSAAGYDKRPYKNFPVIIIQDLSIVSDAAEVPGNFVFYHLSDIDKLNNDLRLGLKNASLILGRMYEVYAPEQIEPLDYYKASIKYTQEFLKLYPKHIIALNSVGYNLYSLGKFEESLKYFNKALEINPSWLTVLANKADASIQLGDFKTAFSSIDIAARLEPDHGEWEWYYAKVYERMKDTDKARAHAKEAVRRGFKTAEELLANL